ncbi:MAG TPA: GNAT family N-acetyltransferase [Thermopetrobacter sp.]|nr:GNAT family N-acetyltransferase [Thermopetrobacter sp.]
MPLKSMIKSALPHAVRARLVAARKVLLADFQDIYVLPLDAPGPEVSCEDDVTFSTHDAAAALELSARVWPDEGAAPARRQALARLEAGDRLIIGRIGDEPVMYGWLAHGMVEMTYGVFVPLRDDIAFSYNVRVHEDHRRRGLLGAYYGFLHARLRQAGYRRLLAGVARSNPIAAAAHRKAGFRKAGHCYTLGLLRRQVTWNRLPGLPALRLTNPPARD